MEDITGLPNPMLRPTDGYHELYDLEHTMVMVVRNMDSEPYAALRKALAPHVLLIHMAGDESLETLNEDQMRAAGWVRAPQEVTDVDVISPSGEIVHLGDE